MPKKKATVILQLPPFETEIDLTDVSFGPNGNVETYCKVVAAERIADLLKNGELFQKLTGEWRQDPLFCKLISLATVMRIGMDDD